MNRIPLLLALLLGLSASAAQADDASDPASGPMRPGWYVAPMAMWMKPDSARCNVDSDFGLATALGHRGEFASIELWGQFLALPHGGCAYTVPAPTMGDPNARATVNEPAGEVTLNGGGLNLLVGPFFEDAVLSRFFGIIGFGVLRREDHPQYRQGDTTIIGDAGFGYAQPFRLFGAEMLARIEARYRYDVQQPPHPDEQDPAPAHAYNDVIINLGLQFALSTPPETMSPPEETVSVVSASAPEPVPEPAAPPTESEPVAPQTDAEPTLETAKAGDTIVLHGVNFETARATLTTNAKTILDEVAAKLVARPGLTIEVGGHTDARGSDRYNQDLSDRRARSVMDYLGAHGVDAARLSAVGYGEGAPVDGNDTDEGRERNRRVELKILEQGSGDANR